MHLICEVWILQKRAKSASEDYSLEDLLNQHQKDIIEVSFTDWVSTGIPQIDLITGGGQPQGRIVELYGPEASGKTTVALLFAKQIIQKINKKVIYIDMEHSINVNWVEKMLGINLDEENKKKLIDRRFLLAQPDSMEEGLDLAEDVQRVSDGSVGLIVFDSVQAGSPQKELEGNMEDNTIGLQAKLMSQAMRKLKGRLSHNKIQAIFINQERDKIGSMVKGKVTSGGNALKYYSQIRMRISRVETLSNGNINYGILSKIETKKNKLYPPFKTQMFQISFERGIDEVENLVLFSINTGLITRKGSYFYLDDRIHFQGKEQLENGIRENNEYLDIIRDKAYRVTNEILSQNISNVIDTGNVTETDTDEDGDD